MLPLVEEPFADRWEIKERRYKRLEPGEELTTVILAEKPKTNRASEYTWQIVLIHDFKKRFGGWGKGIDDSVFVVFTDKDINWR